MIRCLVRGCGGKIRVKRDADGELTFACETCGAGPAGTARRDIEDARRRIRDVRKEISELRRLLGQRDDDRSSCVIAANVRVSRVEGTTTGVG